jgi:anthranilate phosphoribosyltransferase
MVQGESVAWPRVLEHVVGGNDLDEDLAAAVLGTIMRGEAEPTQVAALLTALRAKGESAAESAGFVRALGAAAAPIDVEGRGWTPAAPAATERAPSTSRPWLRSS